jgi:hypothetical protein
MPPKRVSGSAAAVVFALLILATVAAFAWSQKQKRDPLVIDRATFVGTPILHPENPVHNFTPNGDCRHDRLRIRFRTTISDDGTVQIVRPAGQVVLTLDRDVFLKRYKFHTYFWDGRQRGGGIARPGRYKLRVTLLGEDRVLVLPGAIRLHRASRAQGACDAGVGGVGTGANAERRP